MKIIKPSFEILTPVDGVQIIKNIERIGRVCYKSEEFITESSAEKFIKMLISKEHESVLEHEKISVRIICDRGVSHELVRHRIASFSQESTRYCNYSKSKFGNELTFILPSWFQCSFKNGIAELTEVNEKRWLKAMKESELTYVDMVEDGWTPQQARSVLPNSLKTEIVISANLREWRTIFKQRTAPTAHPQMREIMIPLLKSFAGSIPVVFDDLITGL